MNEILLERLIALLALVLGGGGIFAWRYSKRTEHAKVQGIEADVDLKQLELINKYMNTISEMSTDIDTALVTISIINRELTELRSKFVAMKHVAQKLYEASGDRVNLSEAEKNMLKSGDTGDIFMPIPKPLRKTDEKK